MCRAADEISPVQGPDAGQRRCRTYREDTPERKGGHVGLLVHPQTAQDTQAATERPDSALYCRVLHDSPDQCPHLREERSILVWAEGEAKKQVDGQDRNGLAPADAFAIWTIPPSSQDLHLALDTVHPGIVYLFGVSAPIETPETFIARLSGLLKFAVTSRAGKVSLPALVAATAQRSITVQKGLEWLVNQGKIGIQAEKETELVVSYGTPRKDPAGASNLWAEIQSLLAETAAYREHFKRADKDALFL